MPLTRLGWLTTRVPNPALANATGFAFLMRGNATVFSRGFGTLCDTLRSLGVWAEDLRCVADVWVERTILTAQQAGWGDKPSILIGHSRGGRRAICAATRLLPRRVSIDLLICLDVAFPPALPGNVRRAIHLFRTSHRVYPARALRSNDPSTHVENLDLDAPDSPIPSRGLHHLNITASAAVQSWIETQVRGLLTRANPARPSRPPGPAA